MILIPRIHFHHIAASGNVRPYADRAGPAPLVLEADRSTSVVLRTRDTTSSDLYVSHSIRPPMLGAKVTYRY